MNTLLQSIVFILLLGLAGLGVHKELKTPGGAQDPVTLESCQVTMEDATAAVRLFVYQKQLTPELRARFGAAGIWSLDDLLDALPRLFPDYEACDELIRKVEGRVRIMR